MKRIFTSIAVATLLSVTSLSAKEVINKPTPEIMELIVKNKLEQVDYSYVKKAVGIGNRGATEAILIDARPEGKYIKGTIPSSLNITDSKFADNYKQIENLDKSKELIVFCAGYTCEKSPIVAKMLKDKGHKNVKIDSGGEPEWASKNYIEIGTAVMKSYLENNSALLVDARPHVKFMKETILGSISVVDTKADELMGRFPSNKDEKIVTFCEGYSCEKSNILAAKLIENGYKNVYVYAGGVPEWKKENLPTTLGAKKVEDKPKEQKKEFTNNGVKLGSDEGTVDGEWLKALIIENKVPANVQIVNVLSPKDYEKGHIAGSINIQADKLKPQELFEKLPKDKTVIFHCSAGSRSLEAWTDLKKAGIDVSEILYFDANIVCDGKTCEIEVNEPLE